METIDSTEGDASRPQFIPEVSQQKNKGLSHHSLNPFDLLGGAGEDRTRGLLNAIKALSQLSYNPTFFAFAEGPST